MKLTYVPENEISEYLEGVRKHHGSYRKAAKAMEINSAYFTFALNGEIYEVLLKALNITLSPPRRRFTCDMSDEEIARFDAQRGDKSRAQHQIDLMDKWDGVGETV